MRLHVHIFNIYFYHCCWNCGDRGLYFVMSDDAFVLVANTFGDAPRSSFRIKFPEILMCKFKFFLRCQ